MQVNQNVRSGNRVAVVMDGKQVGLMQSVSAQDGYGLDPASGIGDIHVIEHVPTLAKHTLSVSQMALKRSSLRLAGLAMENGDAVLRGLVFDFEVYDKDSGDLLYKYTGCSFDSGSVDIQKHAIIVNSATFLALDRVGTVI